MSTSRDHSQRLRVALFVEGSRERCDATDPLETLWRRELRALLGLRDFDRVVGIAKRHLVSMDVENLRLKNRTSALCDPLDALMKRELDLKPFDAAIVCWDLQPPWDRETSTCRWSEVKQLYRGLAASKALPRSWTAFAAVRSAELESRARASSRSGPPRLAPGVTLAVWMDPMFEGMLVDETGVRLALGLRGRDVPNWPTGWTRNGLKDPDKLLARAVAAARALRPRPAVFKRIRVPFNQAKHEWAGLLLREGGPRIRTRVEQDRTGLRLQELLME